MPWGSEPRAQEDAPGPNTGADAQEGQTNELISTISRITDSGLYEGTYVGASIATTPSVPGSVCIARPQRLPVCSHLHPSANATAQTNHEQNTTRRRWWNSWNKKYVLLCGTCGLSSVLLGSLYLAIYLVLSSYTFSLQFFQTIPTYIPAAAMLLTGFSIISFVRRKNRLACAIKIVGLMCLVCASLCVVVTVTTTVVHMNRLQTLRECTFYTQLHSCTCLPFTNEESFELKLDHSITNCDVIHGPLYSCLRAMFGVSVIGILVSIFSCMLVYQLLSHEKKKMCWQQLENRRRNFYRREPPGSCACCDEYGFTSPSEIYSWNMWEPADERYWNGEGQVFTPQTPMGEDSSNASRSVLVGGGTNQPVTPSLWLPWGGAWGTQGNHNHSQTGRESLCLTESTNAGSQSDVLQSGETSRQHSAGILLRPFIPRGLEARFGLRRSTPPNSHGQRPLSDPGVAFQLPRYPPPFSVAHLQHAGFEAIPRYMWDPPPPYSQPTSSENLAMIESPARRVAHSSPHISHRGMPVLSSPNRPTTLADLLMDPSGQVNRTLTSPVAETGVSPHHVHKLELKNNFSATSIPLSQRKKHLTLGHVKSLENITNVNNSDFINKSKEKMPLERLYSDDNLTANGGKSKHLKSVSDPKTLYTSGKCDQESELYFADVSSCLSLHNEDLMYYADPITISDQKSSSLNKYAHDNVYEIVNEIEEETTSHNNSDDTMIVHTSSDQSAINDNENTFSPVSPHADLSSSSPMNTDTDAYSSYNAPPHPVKNPLFKSHKNMPENRRNGRNQNVKYKQSGQNFEVQTSDHAANQSSQTSDFNGNLPTAEQYIPPQSQRKAKIRSGLTGERSYQSPTKSKNDTPKKSKDNKKNDDITSQFVERVLSSSEPNTPIRKANVQDLLFTLKSVNV